MQAVSPIKRRLIQFVDMYYVSRRDFYSKTGISRGTLENNAGITEDTLSKIFAHNPNLSPLWVITGEGPMLKIDDDQLKKSTVDNSEVNLSLLMKEKDEEIKELKERIKEQSKIIMHLIDSLKKPEEKK